MNQSHCQAGSTGILLSLPLKLWGSGACPAFSVGVGGLNSGPQAFTASPLLTEPLLQPLNFLLLFSYYSHN